MKIDKITLCNLASFEGEQIIDFTASPLRAAGLFAITGDTGAGKSTLLDAICLALYDNAPRFDDIERISRDDLEVSEEENNAIQASDTRNIMRRGQKSAYSLVEFTLHDGSRYEAGWTCRTKRTGSIAAVSRTLKQLSPKKKSMEGSTNQIQPVINELLGLDYTQFSRTVLLAQNSFATFLQAKKKEKSALLEKLTGTEIYGQISMKIFEMATQADTEVKQLEQHISGLLHNRLTPEQLDSAKTDIHQKQAVADETGRSLDAIGKKILWLNREDEVKQKLRDMEQAHLKARKAMEERRADELLMQRYDSVQPVLSLFSDIQIRLADIEQMKKSDEEISRQLEERQKMLQKAEAHLRNSREQTADAAEQMRLRQSDINRGHAITGEIKETGKNLDRLKIQLSQAEERLKDRRSQLKEKQKAIAKIQEELKELKLHHQALSAHRLMFDKIEIIKEKLAQFRSERETFEHDSSLLADLQNKLLEVRNALDKVEKKQVLDNDKLSALKSELMIHRQTNLGMDGTALQKKVSDLQGRLLALRHARMLWSHLSAGYEEIDELRAKIARTVVDADQTRKDIERARAEHATLTASFNTLNAAYMLSNSENIRRLRSSLKEGSACPVCGATHHPYHTETERELGELMDNLEKDHAEARAMLDRKQEQLSELEKHLAATEGGLSADRNLLAGLEQKQHQREEEWKESAKLDKSFEECSSGVNRNARKTMLEMLIDSAQKTAEEREQELSTFNQHQQRINSLTEEIEKLSAQMEDDRTQLDSLRTNQQVMTTQQEALQQRVNKSDRIIEQHYRDLDEYISISEWFTDWKKSPDNLRQRLTDLNNDWIATCSTLDEMQKTNILLHEELHAIEDNEAEANRYMLQQRDERDATEERLKAKQEELRRIFGNTTPEQEEKRLNDYMASMQKQEQEAAADFNNLMADIKLLEGQHRNMEKTRLDHQKEYAEKMSTLDRWILKFNGNHSPLQISELEGLYNDQRDWNALRSELNAMKQERTLAQHNMEQTRQELLTLQADPTRPSGEGDESLEALQKTKEDLERQKKETDEALMRQRMLIMAHEKSIMQAASQEEKLEKARANALEWHRLNQLLGSRDGKKFRELAQSYTFRYLVSHANMQLRRLSPRYELRNLPGTLVLEIIDHDMFDEHRYVSSLSGGETFVVSLALALALANISSHNLSIGSLFIDEGFGNLDHDSLDLVMDALSNLENAEGRKVGVVSHTDQIRQQIFPQIQVRKLAGAGRSKIVVV